MERAMKVQAVILRAWRRRMRDGWRPEIIGISDRHMRRWRETYDEIGYDRLFDGRRKKPSPHQEALSAAHSTIRQKRARFLVRGKAGSRIPLETIVYRVADWHSTCRSKGTGLDVFPMVMVDVQVFSCLANGSNFGLIGNHSATVNVAFPL